MKKILLSGKKGKGKYAIVDDEDFERLNKLKWHYSLGYAKHNTTKDKKWSYTFMHWQILPRKEGFVTDHINGNGLDNRRSNLRYATHQQNAANRKKAVNNSSGFKGVYPVGKKWQVSAQNKEGRWVYLGLFSTKEEAALVYNKAAKEAFGEFANLNILSS